MICIKNQIILIIIKFLNSANGNDSKLHKDNFAQKENCTSDSWYWGSIMHESKKKAEQKLKKRLKSYWPLMVTLIVKIEKKLLKSTNLKNKKEKLS